ncbi:hypothetical protein D918_04901 [Trichuris suis]|nr:hypothetical protein D918_04900 [Trichuris suis]KHJ44667.1 hypothetical protein D918_04901 [Trichuris suis]
MAEREGFTVIVEPRLTHMGTTRKPDLIVARDNQATVLHVAIPFEGRDALARRHSEKCRKYATLKDDVRTLTNMDGYPTGSIIIGARGAWCHKNDDTLKHLGWNLSKRQKALLCLMTLERTNQLISWYMRSTDQLAF